MVELYPRPGGDVNSRENRARRSHRGEQYRRAGGWGYFVRFADPLGELRWSTKPGSLQAP
jgi:hypothetical protein